ncbi:MULTISPECIES: hypothetical protein [unclassified Sphingomonas]|uniref:hypothetical protein n=1 Tax=unclassified Sphingomonas TaxID=196159 RepID=UPI000AC9D1AD|nr:MULTISPECIES: hypothetical protein [unclassified Sphingomonas]
MRAVISSGIAIAAMLGGCEQVDWNEELRSQAAMPSCAGAVVAHVAQESNWQDYSNTLAVTAPSECISRWRGALLRSADYVCNGKPFSCSRYDETGRYSEEYGTITFIAADRATVELTKI